MPTVLIRTDLISDTSEFINVLRQAGFEIRYPENPTQSWGLGSEQETIDRLRGAHAVFAGAHRFTDRVLAALPELRVISLLGVGYDRIDVAAATSRDVAVTITPTANHEAVAEHALALLLATAKSIVLNHSMVREGGWELKPPEPVRGKTLGILGLGRIGRSLALRAAPLQMKIIATETYPNTAFVRQQGIELVDFDTLLARSDYLSLNCPLTGETRGLFHKETFDKMKPGSALINTARGGLVVEADLLAALRSGHLRGAGLDVLVEEPTSPDNPLLKLDNVTFSPHLAGGDKLAITTAYAEAARNVVALYRGEWPEGAVVNDELKGKWTW